MAGKYETLKKKEDRLGNTGEANFRFYAGVGENCKKKYSADHLELFIR